ncbi:helix-turn-helix domain-containing protein [Actinomadura rupiterrae]|uniref:helix-turn-helix domain-containing protein n=1 Tax=Actinomadura rupiterrae TaxID=559627 RepID=UPI0020A44D23|nr:helix-turn-helix transcriptional regulator [Actinomadura rupiterrae]MCP2337819.1 transcriptional regulator with XRE-family HTH domain [Actinomadura rupiterrae]
MPDKHAKLHSFDPQESALALYADKMRLNRARAGLSQTEVGRACCVSDKLISAIENLSRFPGEDISKRLNRLFDVDFFGDQYHQINRELRLPARFDLYVEQEKQAAIVYCFEYGYIPGLLQTEDYARTLMSRTPHAEERERAVTIRMRRQELLECQEPPVLVAVVKEAALRELIGSRDLMRRQFAHLIEMGRQPNISIEVVPNGAGVFVSSGYSLLNFVEGSPVGWTEAGFGFGHLVQESVILHRMRVALDLTRAEALPATESERLIRTLMEDL